MNADRVPYLPRGVRLKFDKVRNTNVLLGPERALMLDDIGNAILQELDGHRTLSNIAGHLASLYNAPREAVQGDVEEFVSGLADKRLVEFRDV